MDFYDFLISTQPINLLELVAAVAVSFYYVRKPGLDQPAVWLGRLLWLTFIVEVVASYAAIAHFSDYRYFGFVQGTHFESNYWLYHLLILLTVGFYCYYFSAYYLKKSWRRIIGGLYGIYVLSSIISLWYTGEFFSKYSVYPFFSGSLLILISAALFFGDILQREQQLKLKSYLPFYVATGAVVFYICLAPLTIFSEYYIADYSEFVDFHTQVLVIANFVMYVTFTLGALICKKNNSY